MQWDKDAVIGAATSAGFWRMFAVQQQTAIVAYLMPLSADIRRLCLCALHCARYFLLSRLQQQGNNTKSFETRTARSVKIPSHICARARPHSLCSLCAHNALIQNGLHIVLCNLKWIQYTSAQTYFAAFCSFPASSSSTPSSSSSTPYQFEWTNGGNILSADFIFYSIFGQFRRQREMETFAEIFSYTVWWCGTCNLQFAVWHQPTTTTTTTSRTAQNVAKF